MKCISSPAFDDAEIMRYVEGEADKAVVAHIKVCPFCMERVARWTQLQRRLRKELYRVTCPSPIELGDLHLGLLPASQVLVVTQHVRKCPLCTRELAEIEGFLAGDLPEAGFMGTTRILIARLISGPGQNETIGTTLSGMALRGEAKGPFTFEVDGIVIVLDIQPAEETKFDILGQVAADDPIKQDQLTGALVELRNKDQHQISTEIDELGMFRFENIVPDRQELRILTKNGPILIVPEVLLL